MTEKKGDVFIDITIKNNPNHFLSPDDWDMVMGVKFGKISEESYKKYYIELLKKRWMFRKDEFIELAKQGKDREVVLKCYCKKTFMTCHAYIAANFMNNLMGKI